MNGAVLFARWARHDGNAGIEQVVPGHFQIGIAATEYPGEEVLQAGIHLVEGVAEPAARFLVDFANGGGECLQRRFQVLVLGIEIMLALGLQGIFIDGREVDRPQPRHPGSHTFKGKLPLRLLGALWHVRQHRVDILL